MMVIGGGNSVYVHKGIYEAFFKDELLTINPNYASTSETFQKYVLEAPADNKQETEEENQQQEAEGEVQEEQTQQTE